MFMKIKVNADFSQAALKSTDFVGHIYDNWSSILWLDKALCLDAGNICKKETVAALERLQAFCCDESQGSGGTWPEVRTEGQAHGSHCEPVGGREAWAQSHFCDAALGALWEMTGGRKEETGD